MERLSVMRSIKWRLLYSLFLHKHANKTYFIKRKRRAVNATKWRLVHRSIAINGEQLNAEYLIFWVLVDDQVTGNIYITKLQNQDL